MGKLLPAHFKNGIIYNTHINDYIIYLVTLPKPHPKISHQP